MTPKNLDGCVERNRKNTDLAEKYTSDLVADQKAMDMVSWDLDNIKRSKIVSQTD